MVLYNEWRLSYDYRPTNLSKEACYRYECLIKYKKLREKGFKENEALEFLNLKRSTFFNWLKRYKNKCGTIKMKTTGLENKSRRPHNLRKTKIITPTLVSHVLAIRQAEPMYGKEKIKRELEKGIKDPQLSTLWRVAEGLNIPLSKLIKEIETNLTQDFSFIEQT